MKILVAVDGSAYAKRMVAYLAAHDEWLGPQHQYTVLTVVPAVPTRAAAVFDKETLQGYYDDESDKAFKPIRGTLISAPSCPSLASASRSGVRLTPRREARCTSLIRSPAASAPSMIMLRSVTASSPLRLSRIELTYYILHTVCN